MSNTNFLSMGINELSKEGFFESSGNIQHPSLGLALTSVQCGNNYGIIPSKMANQGNFGFIARAVEMEKEAFKVISNSEAKKEKISFKDGITKNVVNYHLSPVEKIENGKAIINNSSSPIDTGALQTLSTLSYQVQEILTEQHYKVEVAKYCPITTGIGAWMTTINQLVQYIRSDMQDSANFVNSGDNAVRRNTVNLAREQKSWKTIYYMNTLQYNVMQINELAKSSYGINQIAELVKASQEKFSLVYQKAILGEGIFNSKDYLGLANLFETQDGNVAVDTTTISDLISNANTTNFQIIAKSLYEKFRANSSRTMKPDKFIIPEKDYNQMACTYINPEFPLADSTQLATLKKFLAEVTANPNFEILPNAYFDKENNSQNKNIYLLLNYDPSVLATSMCLPFQSTAFNSLNGFEFQNVEFAQITGVMLKRTAGVYYFTNNA